MKTLLRLADITKSFGAVHALKGVSFDLIAGEVHALVGENGAGKSTLIRIITGSEQPDAGTVEIDGVRAPRLNPAAARAYGIAAIYQQPALFPDLSVAENIALGLEPPSATRRIRWNDRRRRAESLLRRVGAEIDAETEVRQLSMPQQQLVEIARALGAGARMLLMDEPTASLTGREVTLLLDLIRDLRFQRVGIIYISHRLEEVFQIADRVTVLRDGESVGVRNVAGKTDLTESELIRLMVGREVSTIFPPPETAPGETVFSVRNLCCRGSGISDVNLDIRVGEILGVAGLVGAGRTELARVLFGITAANSGTITLGGQGLKIRSPGDAIEAGIAYVPEDRRRHGVILEMSIAANVSLGILPKLYPRSWLCSGAEQSLARQFIRDLGIKTTSPDMRAANLSGGNQQKVALGRWLAAKPKLLILDEPTQGVDIGAKAEIHKLIRRLAAQGMAVLMISSELPEILGMSDRIAVMRGGTVTALFDRRNADAHTIMAAALGQDVRKDECQMTKHAQKPNRHQRPREQYADFGLRHSSLVIHFRTYFREWSVALALVSLLILLAIIAPGFFQKSQLLSICSAAAPVSLVACGIAVVIISRQIDISVGSQFALCSVLLGLLVQAHWPMPLAAAAVIVIGALCGAFNGVLIAWLRLPSIVVTLATMATWREALRWWRQGEFVRDLPESFQWFGLSQAGGQTTVLATTVVLFLVLTFGLKHLAAGRFVYAVGSDAEAARLAGIRPSLVTFGVFVMAGALTGLAALLNAVRFTDVDPKTGTGLELQAIAAAVVGGIAISGGRGRLWGVLAGVLLLACIAPALVFLKLPPQWEKALQGCIILLAVAADGWRSVKGRR